MRRESGRNKTVNELLPRDSIHVQGGTVCGSDLRCLDILLEGLQ